MLSILILKKNTRLAYTGSRLYVDVAYLHRKETQGQVSLETKSKQTQMVSYIDAAVHSSASVIPFSMRFENFQQSHRFNYSKRNSGSFKQIGDGNFGDGSVQHTNTDSLYICAVVILI